MAKRRNLKKEKAERNKAYARKFRKRTTSRRGRKYSGYNQSYGKSNNNEDDDDDESTEKMGAALD